MLYVLGKAAQAALQPLSLVLLAQLVALWMLRRVRSGARGLLAAATLGLWLISTPALPRLLLARLESAYPSRATRSYSRADAVVVLGGTATEVRPPALESEELGEGRLLAAARLYHAGKSKRIVVLGGLPYQGTGGLRSSAADMREVLEGMGVPRRIILVAPGSRNTREDVSLARRELERIGARSALIVTSARHMRRAMVFFRGAKLALTPVPVALQAAGPVWSLSDLVPDPGAISDTTSALKEIVGYWVARRQMSHASPAR